MESPRRVLHLSKSTTGDFEFFLSKNLDHLVVQDKFSLREFVVGKISDLLSKTTMEPSNSPRLTEEDDFVEKLKVDPLMSIFKEDVDLTIGE